MGWTWLFNCNPSTYDLPGKIASGEVREGSGEDWLASQRGSEMRAGDRVYHWVGGSKPGIYAVSTLVGPARLDEQKQPKVDVRFERFVEIPKPRVEAHPELREMTVLRMPRNTNYLLSPGEAHALDALCGLEPTWAFDPADLGQLLRTPLDAPEILTREGMEDKVLPRSRPFLESVRLEMRRRRPSGPELDHARRRSKPVQLRQTLDGTSRELGDGLYLEVRLGLDDATGVHTQSLFAGVGLFSKATEVAGRLQGLVKSGFLRSEQPVHFPGRAFGGSHVLLGILLPPERVETMDPEDLLEAVIGELVKWTDRIEEAGLGSGPDLAALFQLATEDGSFWPGWTSRADERRTRIPLLREKVDDFRRGALSLADFRQWLDLEARRHNLWGFAGISGGMFLNQIAKADASIGVELDLSRRLAEAMSPPDSESAVRERFDGMSALITEIKARTALKGFGPGRIPFFLTFFWEVQALGRWPVLWSQTMAPFLAASGRYEARGELADDYLTYVDAVNTLVQLASETPAWDEWARQNPFWAVEGLAYWRTQHRPPILPPPKPEVDTPVLDRFLHFASARGLRFPKETAAAYYLALQSKPFCILTGISGTGKTKLAELFAEYISPDRKGSAPRPATSSDALFTLTVRPYMHNYNRMHIPVNSKGALPPLEPGESLPLSLEVDGKVEHCRLEQRPHVMTCYIKGALVDWLRTRPLGSRFDWLPGSSPGSFRLRPADETQSDGSTERRFFAFVPVRPDWTDHRGLLGFHHHLDGTYHGTDFLALLLQAHCHEPRQPHFVLLDEMNLARVEHYFSDFLSALETRRSDGKGGACQQPFPLHDQPRCMLRSGDQETADGFFRPETDHRRCQVRCTGCPLAEFVETRYHDDGDLTYDEAVRAGFDPTSFCPPRLAVPWNVFFTGTVNVDETTYTFSPKVLDRAHVLEFQQVDLDGYFAGVDGSTAEAAQEADLLAWTFDGSYPFTTLLRADARRAPALADYRTQLSALVQLLEPESLHFGYRVADEILAFLHCADRLRDPDVSLDVAFDRALLQKLLPRLHGTRERLEAPLRRLIAFCTEAGAPEEDDTGASVASRVHERLRELGPVSAAGMAQGVELELRLGRTARKALSLLRALEMEGFASAL